MKKVLFFILLLWCPFSIVSAQFVNFGQDRPSLRWKQIKTDDFQIIYPDFFEENAQKAASIFSLLYHHSLSRLCPERHRLQLLRSGADGSVPVERGALHL